MNRRPGKPVVAIEVPEAPLRMHVETLAEALKAKDNQTVIIDVRGEDFQVTPTHLRQAWDGTRWHHGTKGGHITGSHNVPYDDFQAHLDELVAQYKARERVVFTCMNSQVRSPSCASFFMNRLTEEDVTDPPEVYVLIGGFQQWAHGRHDDEDLVSDFDSKLWKAIWEATEAEGAP
eukprot:NODE_2937_length_723_cov_305.839763_g2073_i0.p1 GENE.NODE_2937_length_723_cov_305.839763_g2073_i0~~NODE_2937_length_723_cov_305.839763_g2073_i0.p1  ORF type:complete len:197 (+),score=56.75 NODE_2937_length_723_cov_305.839763_g2073_i0:64-591(+)